MGGGDMPLQITASHRASAVAGALCFVTYVSPDFASMLSFAALKDRYQADTYMGGPGAAPSLALALERIGWRAVRDPSPEELSGDLALLVDACVHEHRRVLDLTYGIATTLRHAGPLLDGSLPPIEAYLPAAEEVLRLYVAHGRGDVPGGAGESLGMAGVLRELDVD